MMFELDSEIFSFVFRKANSIQAKAHSIVKLFYKKQSFRTVTINLIKESYSIHIIITYYTLCYAKRQQNP